MTEFTAQEEPIHHIIVEQGSEKYHFWYFLSDPDAKPFDTVNDKKLVEQLHIDGIKQDIGTSKIIQSTKGHKYRSSRLDKNNFAVQSLSCT